METMTPEARVSTLERDDAVWFVGAGFLVWVAATAVVSLLGPTILRPETPLVTAGLSLAMLPSMFLLAVGLFRYRGVVGTDRVLAATVLVLPGMALDSVVVPFFGSVFPGTDPAMAGAFGGIVLVAYVEVLVTGSLLQ